MFNFLKRISLIESLRISSNIFLTYLFLSSLTPFKTCPTSLPDCKSFSLIIKWSLVCVGWRHPRPVRPGRWQAMGTLNAVPLRKANFPSPRHNKVLMDSGLETERYAHIHLWFCLNWASASPVHAVRVSWSSSLCQENTELWNYSQSLAHRGFPPHLLHWAFRSRMVWSSHPLWSWRVSGLFCSDWWPVMSLLITIYYHGL